MSTLSASMPLFQKRAPDPSEMAESPYNCWESNLGPLEQPVLLTSEPSLQLWK